MQLVMQGRVTQAGCGPRGCKGLAAMQLNDAALPLLQSSGDAFLAGGQTQQGAAWREVAEHLVFSIGPVFLRYKQKSESLGGCRS